MPGNKPLVHELPLLVEVAKPIAQAPPSKMRPTWKVATIVEPFEKLSGSTSVWWLVVLEAAHVAWVKGSVLIVRGMAKAGRTDDRANVSTTAHVVVKRINRL